MNTATKTALESAATAKAADLCAKALATLAAGRKTFVKGKPVMVPFSAEKRAEIKGLQLDAFTRRDVDATVQPLVESFYAAEGVTDADSEERFLAEACAVYTAAGVAEVERLFAV